MTVATRLPVGLAARGWGDTVLTLPEGDWADLLTGREYAGDRAAARARWPTIPVALLIIEVARTTVVSTSSSDGPPPTPFAVWAPDAGTASGSSCGDDVGGSVVEMAQATDGWWVPAERAADRGGRALRRLRLRPRRRLRRDVPRPAVASPARWRARAVAHLRPVVVRVDTTRPGPGGSCAGVGDLRAARRHLHARGHPRRRDRAARPPALDSASTSSS